VKKSCTFFFVEEIVFLFSRFRGSQRITFVLLFIWRQAVNPTEKLHNEKYFSLGHKHLAPGNITARKKKSSYLAVLLGVTGTLLCSIFNLKAGRQSYRDIALKKYFSLGHKHLAPGNRVARKKGSYSAVLEGVEGKLLSLIFNLDAGR
jgi:hypothetical protein